MSNYRIEFTTEFTRQYKFYVKRNAQLKKRIDDVLKLLESDPFYSGLKTHKANTRSYGLSYSSRVSGDLRIIWDFQDNKRIILTLTLGGHSGKNKVYN